jgi:hypothetical protein
MTKIQKNLQKFAFGAGLLAFAAVVGAATPAGSAPSYDGVWSVVIVTEKGACDRAYRYPIRIQNGALLAEGSSPATITGKVAGNGSVTVTVSAGSKSATGSGRLSGTAGVGSWKGGECSGTWEAERRGA